MHAFLALTAVALVILSSCGTAPVASGAVAADGAGQDAVGDAISGADAASATDAAADLATGETAPIGDISKGDISKGETSDGSDGSAAKDGDTGGNTSDAADAALLDGKDTNSDVAPGAYTCETACTNIAKANCPADDPVASCIGECGQFTAQAPDTCVATVQELLKCISTATITCKDGGKSDSNVCNYLEGELEKCFGGGPPPNPDPCPAGNCYGGAGPNGEESCGCETNCYGSVIKLDCGTGKCSCTVNGKVTTSFDQGSVCSSNPWLALQSTCGLPTGP